jgi:hypothetical protein
MTPTRIAAALAGDPVSGERTEISCYVCGLPCREGLPAKEGLGSSFTDHHLARAPWSGYICTACVWAMRGKPPHTIRMWSSVWRSDEGAKPSHPKCLFDAPGLHLAGRDDLSEVRRVLLSPPQGAWFAAIAESGQKHILPWSNVNIGETWTVRMDSIDVAGTSDKLACILFHVASLRLLGLRRDDVVSGRPPAISVAKAGVKEARRHLKALAPYSGSGVLSLAVFLTTKETLDVIRTEAASRAGFALGANGYAFG